MQSDVVGVRVRGQDRSEPQILTPNIFEHRIGLGPIHDGSLSVSVQTKIHEKLSCHAGTWCTRAAPDMASKGA